MATADPLHGFEPSGNVGRRSPALKPEHIAVLHDRDETRPGAPEEHRGRVASTLGVRHVRCNDSLCASFARHRTVQANTSCACGRGAGR